MSRSDQELRDVTADRLEAAAQRVRANEPVDFLLWFSQNADMDKESASNANMAARGAADTLAELHAEAQADGEWHPETYMLGWGVQVLVEHARAEDAGPEYVYDDDGEELVETGERCVDFVLGPVEPEGKPSCVWLVVVPLDVLEDPECAALPVRTRSVHRTEAGAVAEAKIINRREGRRGEGVRAFVEREEVQP